MAVILHGKIRQLKKSKNISLTEKIYQYNYFYILNFDHILIKILLMSFEDDDYWQLDS